MKKLGVDDWSSVSSLPMRIAAALAEGDPNILLTGYLTPESRMMIRRNVIARLHVLADRLRELVQHHLRRAREPAGQGKWAEAGKELVAIEAGSRK